MIQQITSHWWMFALRGGAALLFGLFLIVPRGVNASLILPLFGCYAIADGLALVLVSDLGGGRWWAALLNGIASILAGVGILLAMVEPLPLVDLIVAWALARGILEIAAANRLRSVFGCAWMMILSGVLSLLYGTMLLVSIIWFSGNPLISAIVDTLWTSFYMSALGLVLLFLALLLRSARRRSRDGGSLDLLEIARLP